MEYKYYNQFNLSDTLACSISSLISKKENENYVCKIMNVTIPSHNELVFKSPLTNDDFCGPGAVNLNGAQIQAINEKYGYYSVELIPEEGISFFVVTKEKELEKLPELTFNSKKEIKETLEKHCVICEDYFGTFDSRTLIKEFPYLNVYFGILDEWRALTNRVTIDTDVLEKGAQKTLKSTKNNVFKCTN